MLRTDEAFQRAVEAVVVEIEATTDAEIVVVAAGRSGSYRDVALVGATVVAAVVLVAVLYAPVVVPPHMVLVDLAMTWPLAYWLLLGRRAIRWTTTERRRARQVHEAAQLEFVREAVHGTPQRTGVLVYVSALEERVELIPDVGIEGRVPRGLWAPIHRDLRAMDVDQVVAGLRAIGAVLAAHVPPTGAADRLELPNAPRIRP